VSRTSCPATGNCTPPALLSYLTTRLDDEETAAGAASTVWRQIAHGVFSFQGDGSDFRVWAASLAHRRTREHPQPDLAGARAGVVDDIRYVLSALPPNLADALLLRVVVGLDDAAVARVLGTTAAFVHTTVDEALRLLDDCLASRPSPGAPRAEWACAWC
jgi:RNA polymerase sigma-70 factor (ECF subfamily)